MVLAYLGLKVAQTQLIRLLGTTDAGTSWRCTLTGYLTNRLPANMP